MDIIFGVIIGVIVLTILVVVHELGHGIMARRNGVVVEEFGIGFPPKASGKKLKHSILGKNVLYTLNWLPLGGFVKLQGENDSSTGKGDYGAATFWQKTKILLAGVFMNWAVAAVLLSILAAIGLPRILPNQFVVPADSQVQSQPVELVTIVADSAAKKAGLQEGDKILRFAGQQVLKAEDLSRLSKENKGKTVEVIYSRGEVEQFAKVTLRADNSDGKGYLGAGSAQQELIKASWSAPIVGVGTTIQLTAVTLQGLGDVLGKAVSGLFLQLSPDAATRQTAQKNLSTVGDSVAGPVGIFGVIFPAAEKAGPRQLILLSAIISLTLAVMNALPIPALDGGRWFVTALFRVMKRPLSKETEEKIHGTGFMVLMGLVVLVTIADIAKFR
jgi:regulator of sigma E protease